MFKVKDRYGMDNKTYTVYAVRINNENMTEFLFFDCGWRWEIADNYCPVSEVE